MKTLTLHEFRKTSDPSAGTEPQVIPAHQVSSVHARGAGSHVNLVAGTGLYVSEKVDEIKAQLEAA